MLGIPQEQFSNNPQEILLSARETLAYATAVPVGVGKGVYSAVHGILQQIAHPIDNVIYPVAKLVYDATIIGAAHGLNAPAAPDNPFPSELKLISNLIAINPQLYHDSMQRMDQRINALKSAGQAFIDASGPKKVEMLVATATAILVPGYFISAAKALAQVAANLKDFGFHYNPPKFFNNPESTNLKEYYPSIKNYTVNDIREYTKHAKNDYFIYVITEDKQLIISPRYVPDPKNVTELFGINHDHLGGVKSVYAAGEFDLKKGVGQIGRFDNSSGHYAPGGDHLETLIRNIFIKNGFNEMRTAKYDRLDSGLSSYLGNRIPGDPITVPFSVPGALTGVEAVIFNGIKAQQQREAQKELAREDARQNAANLHSQRFAHQQVIAKNRYFNLPFDTRQHVNSSHLVWRAQQDAIYLFTLRYGSVPAWMELQIRSSVYSYASHSLSYTYRSPGMAEFSLTLLATNLINSYNLYNFGSYMYSPWGSYGQIGGVATRVSSTIKDLPNSNAHASANAYYLCFPAKLAPRIEEDLFPQIQQELAHAYYEYGTFPFFSLHFNQQGILYPILHPAFQKSRIGTLIGYLDYWMKGYLNGGIFYEKFLKLWDKDANCDEVYLRSKMIDLKKYCKKNVSSLEYISLRELESRYGVKIENSNSAYQQPIKTAFRIIFEVEMIELEDNIIVPHAKIRIEYSNELMPDYQQHVDSYLQEHGKYPPEYQQTLYCYELFAEEIKKNMPKLPFCQYVFDELRKATGFCYVLATLDKMGKKPEFKESIVKNNDPFPKALPPIPVRYYRTYDLAITMKGIFTPLMNTPEKHKALDQALSHLFSAEPVLSVQLQQQIETMIKSLVTTYLGIKLPPTEISELNEEEITRILKQTSQRILNFAIYSFELLNDEVNKLLDEPILRHEQKKLIIALPLLEKIHRVATLVQESYQRVSKAWEQNPQRAQLGAFNNLPSSLHPSLQQAFHQLLQQNKAAIETVVEKWIAEMQERKATNLAKVTSQTRAANQAKITEFVSIMDQQITALTALLQKLKTIVLDSNQPITSSIIKIQIRIEMDKEKVNDYSLEELAKIFVTAMDNDCCQVAAATLKDIRDNLLKRCASFTDFVQQPSKQLIENPHPITEKYTHTFLSFTSKNLVEKTGDNFQIIGGCSVALPNIISQPIPRANSFCLAVSGAFTNVNQSKGQFIHNGQTYDVYKVSVVDVDAELTQDPKKALAIHALESVIKNQVLPETLSTECIKTVVDHNGSTLMHYAAATLKPEHFVTVLKTREEVLKQPDHAGYLPIHSAAQSGNVEAIATMVAKNKDLVDIKSKRGLTPLMISIQYGQQRVMEFLHTKGANFNETLPNGLFPLYMAIQKNFTPLALWMLEHVKNLEVNKELDSKMTPLHLAIQSEVPALPQRLVEKGAHCDVRRKSDGFTALHCAAKQGDVDLLVAMLRTGISVNLLLESKKTPLHLAAEAGKLDAVKLLIERGALVDAKTLNGETALMLAIKAGRAETAIWLAEKAAINMVNQQKQTASLLSLQYAMPVVGDILIRRGENPDSLDYKGLSYLYYLVRNGEYHRFKMLVDKKLVTTYRLFEKNSLSLLAIAAQYGHFLLVYYLQKQGIPYMSKSELTLMDYALMADEIGFLRDNYKSNKNLHTLALIAVTHGAKQCLAFLLKHMPATARQNDELLIAAIVGNDEKILELILKHCKDINKVVDKNGNTPLHIAIKHGAHNALSKLAESGCQFLILNSKKQTAFHLAVLQEDADMLKRLFKLSLAAEWPADLWNVINKRLPANIIKVLKKYEKLLPKDANTSVIKNNQPEITSLTPTTKLPTCFELTVEQRGIVKKFKNYLDHEQFNKATTMLEQNAFLLAIFKSDKGGKLLKCIFKNIKERSTDLTTTSALLIKQITEISSAMDKLLYFLKKNNINPVHFLGKDNLFLVIARSENDTQACFRLSMLEKYFPDSLAALAQDKMDEEISIAQLALKKNFPLFFEKMDELCNKKNQENTEFNGLHQAILANNYDIVVKSLQRYSVNSINHKGETPLMLAASLGNVPIIELLLKKNASVNQLNFQGQHALHYALSKPSEAAALLLLPLLKKPNQANRLGVTPLMLAASKGLVSVLRFICESGQDMQSTNDQGYNALHYAALEGQVDSIKYLVKQGFAVDQSESPTKPKKIMRSLRRTPLHLAAVKAQEDAVLCLLELNANPKQEDTQGFALTEYAVSSKNREMLELVKRLPFYHDKNRNKSLLHAATAVGNIQVVTELIIDQADLNAIDSNGRCALHLACINDEGKVGRRLLKDPNIILDVFDKAGYAPLHYAAAYGHILLIELLADAGVNLDQCTIQSDSALALAAVAGRSGAVITLLKRGADLTQINKQGMTPAQVALLTGQFPIVQIFREAGDQSLQPSTFSHLPEAEKKQLSAALPQFFQQYREIKTCALMQHGFYKPEEKRENKVAPVNSANVTNLIKQ